MGRGKFTGIVLRSAPPRCRFCQTILLGRETTICLANKKPPSYDEGLSFTDVSCNQDKFLSLL